MFAIIERGLVRCIEAVCLLLLLGLTGSVVYATTIGCLGASPSWYDEIASMLLAWLTYFGASYVIFQRQHMSFGGLVAALPRSAAVNIDAVFRLSGHWLFRGRRVVWQRGSGRRQVGFTAEPSLDDP